MAKLTDLPFELIARIADRLFPGQADSSILTQSLSLTLHEDHIRLDFFNLRQVNRTFLAATTSVFFRGCIMIWAKRGSNIMEQRIALEKRYARIQLKFQWLVLTYSFDWEAAIEWSDFVHDHHDRASILLQPDKIPPSTQKRFVHSVHGFDTRKWPWKLQWIDGVMRTVPKLPISS